MRTLLNRIDKESAFWDNVFLLAKIVLVSAFILVLVFGVRLLVFYPKVEGSIVKIISDDKNEFIAARGRLTSHDCMSLWLNSFTYRFIHRKTQYAELFNSGDEVKLWVYKLHGEYQIVHAKRGDEILIKHNSILANIVFVLMVGSLIVVLLEFIVKKVTPKRD
ncbi:hypothetical protein [Alkaliflexus imshenetskii]|uniref:hypothetical protein n=1 Tax=Alkaliflexus imshenetskii TaxID=286730 RepID=UPI00047AB549|nr:hypothetical protein [Alkaliflexus imshenetskii]